MCFFSSITCLYFKRERFYTFFSYSYCKSDYYSVAWWLRVLFLIRSSSTLLNPRSPKLRSRYITEDRRSKPLLYHYRRCVKITKSPPPPSRHNVPVITKRYLLQVVVSGGGSVCGVGASAGQGRSRLQIQRLQGTRTGRIQGYFMDLPFLKLRNDHSIRNDRIYLLKLFFSGGAAFFTVQF